MTSPTALGVNLKNLLNERDLVGMEHFLKGFNFRDTRLTHYLIFRNRSVNPMTAQISRSGLVPEAVSTNTNAWMTDLFSTRQTNRM